MISRRQSIVRSKRKPRTAPARASWATSDAVRAVMSSNRKKNTSPELRLRSALYRLGLRYRIHAKPIASLSINADVVFRNARVAVFVDGCFWHGCEVHGTWPVVNRDYWLGKISGNAVRDRRVDDVLRRAGWEPIRVWEHELAPVAASRILELVRTRRQPANPM